ncbi:long-chain fatty acid--CoA ligase [Lachnoclostridium sp. An196]|uniref:AMP-binding protein n=1 Tax=Lachnoclostridium sp. An196 TaxID=1965583 RepID=UPI000B3766D9|nr:AMP-binding protein [Lachnoclostridium sp. An196]OUP19829.1 long-chain fatty acid--CoA ligase [Lachnoclostridium sp. An196]
MLCSTIREILVNTEKVYGPEDAIRYKIKKNIIETKTYSQLKQDSESFSCALEALGERGSHIAVTGATSYPWLVTYFGTVNSGSVAVPLDVSLPAEDLCELIDRADATVLVADELRKDLMEIVKSRCPKLRYLISMQKEESDEETLSFRQLLREHEGVFGYEPEPDSLCTIMFTSGTTGKSKGVMLTQRNLAENATCLDMKIPPRTVILSVLPIHHAYCLSMDILKGISLGSVICINDSLLRVVKNIKLFQPNMILMVPLMIETMAKKLEEVSGLPPKLVKWQVFGKQFHTICSGGAYLPPAMIDLFDRYGITILQGYGMTECSPVISTTVSWNIRKESVGQLLPNCEAKTVDEELWVRGSSVMMGYYKMPEETAQTLEDGWLKTGDLGYADEDGFVYLTGRKKNLIITKNGENVSPEELENKIGEHRLVQEILVREKDGVIEAEIYPDYDYIKKKRIKDVSAALQQVIDEYNQGAPAYKKVYSLKVRETEFEKTTSRKIKRF